MLWKRNEMLETPAYEKCYKLRVKTPEGVTLYELSTERYSRAGSVLGFKDAFRCMTSGKEVKSLYRDGNERFPHHKFVK